jgi:hypothetical protein
MSISDNATINRDTIPDRRRQAGVTGDERADPIGRSTWTRF